MERIDLLFKSAVAATGGVVAYWLGGLDKLLISLLVLIVVDYITGILKGIYHKNLSSEIGFKGIAKKVMCLSIVALAFVIQNLTDYAFAVREIVIVFFIANEGISILENAAQIGLPVPRKLRDVLEQLKGKV